jgi:hypothetical protein
MHVHHPKSGYVVYFLQTKSAAATLHRKDGSWYVSKFFEYEYTGL